MGEFIQVILDHERCRGHQDCVPLIPLCPVDVFVESGSMARVDQEQVDECTLCGLCWESAPGVAEVHKLYEMEGEER